MRKFICLILLCCSSMGLFAQQKTFIKEVDTKQYIIHAEALLKEQEAKQKKKELPKPPKSTVGKIPPVVKLDLPDQCKLYSDTLKLRWELNPVYYSKENLKGYRIRLIDMFDSTIFLQNISENFIQIDLSKDKMANEKRFLIKIIPIGKDDKVFVTSQSVDGYTVEKLASTDRTAVATQFRKLQAAFSQESISERYLATALMFEDNTLFADAINAYETALEVAEDSQKKIYEGIYKEFRNRHLLD